MTNAAQKIPATPAGKRLVQFLAVQSAGSQEQMRQFIVECYAPQSDLEGKISAYMHEYQLRYFVSRGYDIDEVIGASPHLLTVGATENLTGHQRQIRVEVESDSPHRIISLRVTPAATASSAGPLTPDEVGAACDQFLRKLSKADAFSGAVLITYDGKPVLAAAYGAANQRYQALNRVDTAFAIGSVGKMFTGVAVAQLVERGLLAFDAPVVQYLPDYPVSVARQVTIHHLLTHTSGLDSYWGSAFAAASSKVRTVDDYMRFIWDQVPTFEPGSQFHYSNAGYILLGAVIERVTGRSYYDHVRETIFDPIGMARTGFYERDEVVANVAMGYTRLDDEYKFSLATVRENLYATGAKGCSDGGAYSTVTDLDRFCDALFGHRLLSPAMTQVMTTGKIAVPYAPGDQYGYGITESRDRGQTILGHSGGNPGTSAHVEAYPELGYRAIILSNYDFAFSVREHIRYLILR